MKQYDLSLEELLDALQKYDAYSDEFRGFGEKQIAEAEERLGVKLPLLYRDYLKRYGKHEINDAFNHLNKPKDIESNYTTIEEEYEDYVEEYEDVDVDGLSQEELEARFKEDPIFHLVQLPKERWNEAVKEVILIWSENQGVWEAGFYKEDLENGIENPPVYYSFDNYAMFEPMSPDLETFLKEMLFFAAWELVEDVMDIYESHSEIIEYLDNTDIDKSRFCQEGIHTCLDTETGELYLYLNTKGEEYMLTPIEDYDEEE